MRARLQKRIGPFIGEAQAMKYMFKWFLELYALRVDPPRSEQVIFVVIRLQGRLRG